MYVGNLNLQRMATNCS